MMDTLTILLGACVTVTVGAVATAIKVGVDLATTTTVLKRVEKERDELRAEVAALKKAADDQQGSVSGRFTAPLPYKRITIN